MEFGVAFAEFGKCNRKSFLASAEEKDFPAAGGGFVGNTRNQIRAGNAFAKRRAECTRGPYEGRAVAKHQIGFDEDALKFDVFAGLKSEI